MKSRLLLFFAIQFLVVSCIKLDLNPLSEGSAEEWYTNPEEFEMSLNNLLQISLWWMWTTENVNLQVGTDDLTYRGETNEFKNSTLNADNEYIEQLWTRKYKLISRAVKILEFLGKEDNGLSEKQTVKYEAISRFVIASAYSYLIFHWGDVPYYEKSVRLEDAYLLGRTEKEKILTNIYRNFDFAAENLPLDYGNSELLYPTKGAAWAMKARIALFMHDYKTARDAAKSCMELEVYELNPSFREQFLSRTKRSKESIFILPRSVELGEMIGRATRSWMPRLNGGFNSWNPTYDLMNSFLCTDGLPIDQSSLYDARFPFKNRDPRLSETIVPIGSDWLGFRYQPHPDSLTTRNLTTGQMVNNNDSRAVNINAGFNGLTARKGIDEDFADDQQADPDHVVIRFADVLLMFAEAKIELKEIDQSVLDAINQVRARAYGVAIDDVAFYPVVVTMDQGDLRSIIRFERRMEFAFEGQMRYDDLIRWEIAEKAQNMGEYGLLDVEELRSKVVNTGLWFFPGVPTVDRDGIPDLSNIYDAGLIKITSTKHFDKNKDYLWPIPAKEFLVNKDNTLTQNPGY